MKVQLTKREWDAVLYAIDLWLGGDHSSTYMKNGKRAEARIRLAKSKCYDKLPRKIAK